MPALLPFETTPELFLGLTERFRGSDRAPLAFKDRAAGEWRDITYDELADAVWAFAAFLHEAGVRKGDRVAIMSENRPEWAITDLATHLLGAVNVGLYTTLPPDQVAYILRDADARVLVVSVALQLRKALQARAELPRLAHVVAMHEPRASGEGVVQWEAAQARGRDHLRTHRREIEAAARGVRPDDVAALIYTSGTTGHPKGVMITQRNTASNVHAVLSVLPIDESDSHLSFLPLSHSFERTGGYMVALAAGCKINYAESIEAVPKNLLEVSPTLMVSVPRLFERTYNVVMKSVAEGPAMKRRVFDWALRVGRARAAREKAGRSVGPVLRAQNAIAHRLVFGQLHEKMGGRLRFAVSGGAALPAQIGEFFEAAGIRIIEGYGLTETGPVLSVNPYRAPRYGTVGHVIPGVTIGIQDIDSGEVIAQLRGEDYPSSLDSPAGEIVARGPNIMKGYWNAGGASGDALGDDGWYHTGDVGRFEGGYLRITDRIKHMIVSKGGKNIYPGPIEEQFATDPLIEQVMVVGEGREFLTALVVPNLDALAEWARQQGIPDDRQALLAHERTRALFTASFRDYSKGAASHERIRDFRLLAAPFSEENGMMTPTMKLRRSAIEQSYAALIEEMYADVV
jgi:long-chain acyl-CoA synthetase